MGMLQGWAGNKRKNLVHSPQVGAAWGSEVAPLPYDLFNRALTMRLNTLAFDWVQA